MPKKQLQYFPSCVVKVYKGIPVTNSQYNHLQNMNPQELQTLLAKHLQSKK
jgi:hypothetical protein